MRVAVIDLGFAGLRDAKARGSIPASATAVDFCKNVNFFDAKHGTAVAEIVAEEAPRATLYLICVDDLASLARAEAFVVANKISIVNHSVGWFNQGRGDGTGGPGTVDAIVADAHAHGVLWINAAGNETRRHWSGRYVDANGDGSLDFAPGADGNYVSVPAGGYVCAFLRWYEWPRAQHHYELSLFDDGNGLTYAATQVGNAPVEQLCWGNGRIWDSQAAGIEIRVTALDGVGSAPLELSVMGVASLEYSTAAGSIADPATSPNVLAVGAVCWQTGELEYYSSQGPTVDGRVKPDLVAPDSVSSPTYGPFNGCGTSGFAGTSASAPHVTGAAALVKQRYPLFNADGIRSYLMSHATDLGPVGADNLYGGGRLVLPAARD